MGDPARLRQILLNLAGNAVKFTEQGFVTITVDLQGQLSGGTQAGRGLLPLRFSVRDTGIGISEEEMPRLFQPFSQADASIRRRYGGSGLGLVICRRLAEALGGSISVTSIKGEGSCFQLNLPMARAPEERWRRLQQSWVPAPMPGWCRCAAWRSFWWRTIR